MKKNKLLILGMACLMLAAVAGSVLATDVPSSAVVIERVWNDSFASILTVNNMYPSYIQIDDECYGPLGWANLHVWRFSTDGTTAMEFENTDGFSFYADVTITGTGDGEGGLQIRPWWSESDGRFHLRTTDGAVECWGGRLPYYNFGTGHGVTYIKGTTVRMGMIYRPNVEMNETMPATIEYIYDSYSSGELPFDMGNPNEDPPHGLWGILTPAQAGGFFQFNDMAGAGEGANFNVLWENIEFQDLGSVVAAENSSWGAVKTLYRD
jgi:hypothetical protein